MIVQGDEDARRIAINAGFADCITKPFNPINDCCYVQSHGADPPDTSALLRIFFTAKVPNEYPHL